MMVEQYQLIRDDTGKSKTFIDVLVSSLHISPHNPRKTRPETHIESLAQRIERNGFEITRALWAYQNEDGYAVFAGGNRLEAVRLTSIDTVPIVLHEGFDEDDYARLAYEDNENDEYHRAVSMFDLWDDCARKEARGWTQQRIADAIGTNRTQVAWRLKWAQWPQSVRRIVTKHGLNERHLRELLPGNNPVWSDEESTLLHIIESVTSKQVTPRAKHFEKAVELWNKVVALADKLQAKVPDHYRDGFVASLSEAMPRTQAAVQQIYDRLMADIARLAKQESDRAEAAALESQRRIALLSKIVHGDARHAEMPSGIKLMFTDPPYGKDFQSNRRTATHKAEKISDDGSIEDAVELLSTVLDRAYPNMADNSWLIVWSDWRHQCEFAQVIAGAGFTIRSEIIWNKSNHTSGDLQGAPAPKHEKAWFAVKGNPKFTGARFPTVLDGSEFVDAVHPTKKPIDLIRTVIESLTTEGDLVADPFAGIGSVPHVAQACGRDFWACEVDKGYHMQACEVLLGE